MNNPENETDLTEVEIAVELECGKLRDGEYCEWAGTLIVNAQADDRYADFEWKCPECGNQSMSTVSVEGMFDVDPEKWREWKNS